MKLFSRVPKPIKLLIKRIFKQIKLLIFFILGPKSIHMSQAGQDLWVYGEAFNEMKNGYFLDIGAHDGINLSNSFILEFRYDWNGILVEANPRSFALLKKSRHCICVNACLDSDEGLVDFVLQGTGSGILSPNTDNHTAKSYEVIKTKTKTLESILMEHNAPHIIDYLSIDVEGAEERILGTFNFHEYLFNCITIERPTKNLRIRLKKNGYILVKEIPLLDCFYIHKSFFDRYQTNIYKFYDKKFIQIRWK